MPRKAAGTDPWHAQNKAKFRRTRDLVQQVIDSSVADPSRSKRGKAISEGHSVLAQGRAVAGIETAYDRKENLLAEKAALALAEKLGLVISKQHAEERMTDVITAIRSAVEKIPVRVAHDLAAESDPGKVRVRLESEVHDVFAKLAQAFLEKKAEEAA